MHRFLATIWAFAPLTFVGAISPESAPLQAEITLLRSAALIKPITTLAIKAPLSGNFTLMIENGIIEKGTIIGKYDEQAIHAKLASAELRLHIAQQQEAEFMAELPSRRHEAKLAITELESRLSLLKTIQDHPELKEDLPESLILSLLHEDIPSLEAKLQAAMDRVKLLAQPDYAKYTSAHLQGLEAHQTVQELKKQLESVTLYAPFTGRWQAGPLLRTIKTASLSVGQEIGTIRDTSRLVAIIAANSPLLARASLAQTELTLKGPGGMKYTARFRETSTERTPISSESRVCWYEFSKTDSEALAGMIMSNTFATITQKSDRPLAVINKLQAALDYPGVFETGWSEGVKSLWPDWEIAFEGETALGLVKQSREP